MLGDEYFARCDEKDEPYTITGLCIALGFCSRSALIDYGDGKHDSHDAEFSNTVKGLKIRCEQFAEKRLFGNSPTGAIFALKNYNWSDKQELEHSGELAIKRVVKVDV